MRDILTPPKEYEHMVLCCRTQLVIENSFYATLLLSSSTYYPEQGETESTDGDSIYIPVPVLEKHRKNPDDLVVGFKHEVIHKALLHVPRKGNRTNHTFWNVAIDIVTNGIIRHDRCHNKLLPTDVVDESLENESAEYIYARMLEEHEKERAEDQGNGDKSDSGGGEDGDKSDSGGGEDGDKSSERPKFAGKTASEWNQQGAPEHWKGKPLTEAESAELSAKVKIQVAKAITLMKQAGETGTDLYKKMAEMLEPKIDWADRLRDFITMTGCDDYTFASPNRRYMAHGFYMPSVFGNEVGRIAVIFDTSGSIYAHQKLVNQFATEINAIAEDVHPEALDVLYVDTEVAGHDTFEQGEDFIPDIKGGGGTAFKSAFDYLHQMDEPPVAVIVFTDMAIFDLDKCECDYPTLWLAYGCGQHPPAAPFGLVVPIED